ncbi:hypothetical protein [Methylobacillus flagellatus]|uniref:hypothetical protein n=1 Tax=Methylobacillus flagellatus TaxID=405 RepID=UPI0010F994B6|nr:hypothetical protein [Methylobacillus flagellatus]
MNRHGLLGLLSITLGLAMAPSAQAADSNDMLVYISPKEFTHSYRLSEYYNRDFWYSQATYVEPLAKEKFGKEFGSVGMCRGLETGKTLVWLKPSMFYNPLMRVFYSRVTANVYASDGQPLATFVSRAEQPGFLGYAPQHNIDTAYSEAMEGLVKMIKADSKVQAALSTPIAADTPKAPCANIALITPIAAPFALDLQY